MKKHPILRQNAEPQQKLLDFPVIVLSNKVLIIIIIIIIIVIIIIIIIIIIRSTSRAFLPFS